MRDRSVGSTFGEMLEPGLRLYLLGTPMVEWQGQNITIPRRNTRALLYRLAAALNERSGVVSREGLCLLFWPDSPDKVARRNLSHLLTHLRRALPDPELLRTSLENVYLEPWYIWSDINYLEQVFVLKSKNTPQIAQAIQYYRGPFLHGCSIPKSLEFDSWVTRARSTYEHQYLELLSELIDRHWQTGDYASGIASARRYLETDDLAETIHRKLIEFYMTVGDVSAARGQLETCVTILERELGVSPMPETWSACQPVIQVNSIKDTPHLKGSTQMAALSQGLPFVSRESELDPQAAARSRQPREQQVHVG